MTPIDTAELRVQINWLLDENKRLARERRDIDAAFRQWRERPAQQLAAMTAARDEACDQWQAHLDGAIKRAVAGEDGGYWLQREALERVRKVGTP